jgi:hypothetical protein
MAAKQKTVLTVVLVLVLAGVLVRFLAIPYGHPDAYYRDEDDVVESALYTLSGDFNPHLYKYPHLLIHILAFSFRISGNVGPGADPASVFESYMVDPTPFVIVARVVALCLSLVAIPAVFLLGRRLWGTLEGGFAALLLAVSPLHIDVTRVARVDGPATAFAVVAVYFAVRFRSTLKWRDLILAGLAVGAAAGFKYYVGLVALPVLVLLLLPSARGLPRYKRCLAALGMAGAFFISTSPHLVMAFREFMAEYARLAGLYTKPYWGVEGEGTLPALTIPLARYSIGVAGLVGTTAYLARCVSRDAREPLFNAIATLGLPFLMLVFFLPSNTFFMRFWAPTIPFLCLASSRGLLLLVSWRNQPRYALTRLVFPLGIIAAAGLVLLIADSLLTADWLIRENDTRLRARRYIEQTLPNHMPVVLRLHRRLSPYLRSHEQPLPHKPEILMLRLAEYAPSYGDQLDRMWLRLSQAVPDTSRPVFPPGSLSRESARTVVRHAAVVVPRHRAKALRASLRDSFLEDLANTHSLVKHFPGSWSTSFGPPIEIWLPKDYETESFGHQ